MDSCIVATLFQQISESNRGTSLANPPNKPVNRIKVVVVANTSWYLYNFRLPLLKELRSRDIDVIIVAPSDHTSERFVEMSLRYIDIPVSRKGLNPFTDLYLLTYLRRIYRTERPDVVFHNTVKPVIYGSIAARFAKVKRVFNMIPGLGYVFTGNRLVHRLLRPIVKTLYRFALRDSSAVFFQNPEDREYFCEHSIVSREKTEITFGSGVDLDHFYFVGPVSKNHDCTFLLLGRMLWDKGVGEFVECAKVLKPTFPGARFHLLGKLDRENPTHIPKTFIDKWVNEGYIEYFEELDDVRSVIAHADVVVLPSYYREGVPKSLLEALAMGKPIITTDTPGCRETVVHNVNGILIPPRDAKALADALRFMITQPERRIEMGKESRRLAVERFDVKRVNAMILKTMNIS